MVNRMPEPQGSHLEGLKVDEWDVPDRCDLGDLQDFKLKSKAISAYTETSARIVLMTDPQKIWRFYRRVSSRLRSLYSQSKDGDKDYNLVDFLLLRRVWERIKQLKGGANDEKYIEKMDFDFNIQEKIEIDSMQDQELLKMAKDAYANIVVELESCDLKEVYEKFESALALFERFYAGSGSRENDLSKWRQLFTYRMRALIAKKGKSSLKNPDFLVG